VNEITVTGVLAEVVEHDSPTGKLLTARLRFSKQDEITIIAVSYAARTMAGFDSGDAVCCTGKIVSHNGTLAVMLIEISHWRIATPKKKHPKCR